MSMFRQAEEHTTGRGTGFSGAELGAAFYREVVGPLVARELPRLRHAAARLGSGSDVLGFDDPMSRDHDWGCRLTLLVDGADRAAVPELEALLAGRLPDRFAGYPVRFATTWDATVSHRVEVATVADFAAGRLGVNPLPGLSSVDWLTLQFRLLSAAVASDLMSLAFLLHRQWQPYRKWCEAMLMRLPRAAELAGLLTAAATAAGWQEHEAATAAAIEILLPLQRQRGLPTPAVAVTRFFDRPYQTVAGEVPDLLLTAIDDPVLSSLSVRVGSADQWADADDVLAHPGRRAALAAAYRAWLDAGNGSPG